MFAKNLRDAQQGVQMAGRSCGCNQYLHAGKNTGLSDLFQALSFVLLKMQKPGGKSGLVFIRKFR
jgi:hypothetical protein